MAKAPRVAVDDDGFQVGVDSGDLVDRQNMDIDEDFDEDVDLLGGDDDDDSSDDLDDSDGSDDDDDDIDSDEDGDEDDDEGEGDSETPKGGRPKAKGDGEASKPRSKARDRIEELAAKRREAEAQAFKAEMEAVEERRLREALEARIAALESGTAESRTPLPKKPDPKDFDYGEVDTKYVDALVEYKLASERAEFQNQQTESQKRAEDARNVERYKARLAQFMQDGPKKFKDYETTVNAVDFPADIARDVLDSDQGVDISYYLARNLGKLREMMRMSDAQRAKAMGRLEERFSARASAGKKRTKAPETPGRKTKNKATQADARYGPDDQDEFDKALFGR